MMPPDEIVAATLAAEVDLVAADSEVADSVVLAAV